MAAFGLASELCGPSVVMMGFRSPPFLLFFCPLAVVALFTTVATFFAWLVAAFLRSPPFMVALSSQVVGAGKVRWAVESCRFDTIEFGGSNDVVGISIGVITPL